LRQFALYS